MYSYADGNKLKILSTSAYTIRGIPLPLHAHTYILKSLVVSFRHPYLLETLDHGRFVVKPRLFLIDQEVAQSYALVL